MRLLALVALTALFFPHSIGSYDGGNLINAVLGNSNIQHLPPGTDETVRIQTHLFAVAERLSARDMRGLSVEQRRARARNIVRLVQYASAGRFPHKPAGIPDRIPNFLDDDGAVCAVGYLVEQDLGIDAVREIARDHQFDYVPYIDSPVLATWQQKSGLTPLELAMIQPAYDYVHHPSEEELTKTMRGLEQDGFAGQVVVARHRDPILDACYGFSDSARTVRVGPEISFDIASATKAFTAAAIYSLVLDDRLHFTDTLADLIPDTPPDKRTITVEQLLGHSSGLAHTYAADGEIDRTKALAKLLAQPLMSKPGKMFRYSDDGYVVLAAIIEIASGMTYEAYLEKHITNVDHMKNTTFWGDGSGLVADFSRPLDASLTRAQWGQRGSGGIITTARDLYWWTDAFLRGKLVGDVQELIKPRWQLKNDVETAYGWFRTHPGTRDEVLWTRGNEDFGHNALVAIYRRTDNVLVVTSNRFKGDEPWCQRVQKALEPLLLKN